MSVVTSHEPLSYPVEAFNYMQDPTNHCKKPDSRIGALLRVRGRSPVPLEHYGHTVLGQPSEGVTGSELLYAEAVHMDIAQPDDPEFERYVGVDSRRASELYESLYIDVEAAVVALEGVADKIRNTFAASHHTQAGEDTFPGIGLLGFGAMMNGHYGQKDRVNGRPFYTHPLEVADMVALAIQQTVETSKQELDINPRDRWIALFVARNHDNFEEALRADKRSFLEHPRLLVSPLVLRVILERNGMGDYARDAARSQLLLSRPYGLNPAHRMPYGRFREVGLRLPVTGLVAVADMQHNSRVDPKQLGPDAPEAALRKLRRKQDMYKKWIQRGVAMSPLEDKPEWGWAYSARQAVAGIGLAALTGYQMSAATVAQIPPEEFLHMRVKRQTDGLRTAEHSR